MLWTMEATAPFDPVLVSEVARILHRSAETVRALERAGTLRAIRTAGGVRVFNRADVERFARERADLTRPSER